MNRRMFFTASLFKAASASMRTYSVGTPMNTVARGMAAMTALGSNLGHQIILLPLMSAPWMATNRPWTWKMGKA